MLLSPFRAFLLALLCLGFVQIQLQASAPPKAFSSVELRQGFRNGRLLAKPHSTANSSDLVAQEQRHGANLHRTINAGKVRVLDLSASTDVRTAADQLRASGLYDYVEPDYIRHAHLVPNDPDFSQQWSLQDNAPVAGVPGPGIDAVNAWNIRSTAPSVIVAVIDSGIRITHEDLTGSLWQNPKETANNIDDDGNGYVDDIHGINTLVPKGSAGDADISDNEGHGTAVTSVIGATGNNGKGIAGVAWKTQLMILKFNDATEGSLVSNEIICLNYAVANGAKVVNISYGSSSYSQTEYDAIKAARDAGVIVVVSAGNDGASNDTVVEYPASYALENIVSVANSDTTNSLDPSSTYGGLVELAAPGTNILACDKTSDTSYLPVSGTSLAAPHVTGSLALLAAQFPTDTYRQLINRLLRSVDTFASLSGKVTTGGRLNLNKALNSTVNRPFNDDFANASVISGSSTATRAASLGATAESGETGAHASLWWSWTAPTSGAAVVDTTGSSFDTIASVYTGTALNTLSLVGTNDNFNGATTSRVSFSTTAGTTYHISIDGKNGATGMVSLSVGLVPPNDNFANATALSTDTGTIAGTIANASREAGEPTLSGDGSTGIGKTVWYKWTAPATDSYSFSVFTSSFSPIIGVYTGTGVAALSSVQTDTGSVLFNTVAGKVYDIAVDSTDTSGGFTLTYLRGQAVPLGTPVTPSPTIAPDGSLVIVDSDANLFYYQSTSNFFDKSIGGTLDVNTPAAADSNTFYVSTSTGLYAVKSNNTTAWSKTYSGVASSPAISAAGVVYIHSDDGFLHALNPDGSELWSAVIPGISYSSPAVGPDGTIYIGSDNDELYALNPSDGSFRWTFDAGGQIYSSPALGWDGTIYFGTLNSQFFALNANGTQKWAFTAGGEISSSAALAADGTVYFGSYDDKLYALNPDGTLKWTFTTGDQIRASSPAVAADGTVYIGSYDGKLYGITAAGTQKSVYTTAAQIRSSPVIDSVQGLLFGSGDHNEYIIDLGGVAAANSPWPMFRQNPQRTGLLSNTSFPVISSGPSSTGVVAGASTTLSVFATSSALTALTYQWNFNGNPISGATQSTYTIANATSANAGAYSVTVSNSTGSVTSYSATVSVVPASDIGRIVNLSARASSGTGDQTLIIGLVTIGGTETKPVLVRALGPSLVARGVADAIDDPKLELFAAGSPLASDDDWDQSGNVSSISQQVGASGTLDSRDAALVINLPTTSSGYTAQVVPGSTSTVTSGVALAEFYDASASFTSTTPRLKNISARAQVGQGDQVMILGFVIGGTTPVRVLIRALGPELIKQGLTPAHVLADPTMTLRKLDNTIVATNDNWGDAPNLAEVKDALAKLTTNDLDAGSKDAVIVVTLQPGVYTAVVSGVNNTTGIALAEIYEAP